MLRDSKFQGTEGILFKVLLQGTALQGAAHVEVLRFCRTLFQRSEIGLTVTFWVGLSPLNRLLKPIPILSHTIYFIQIFYSNHLFFFHENFSFITDYSPLHKPCQWRTEMYVGNTI